MKIGTVPLEKSKTLRIQTLNFKKIVAQLPHFDPLKKLTDQFYLETFFRCLHFRTPEGWNFLN